MCDERVGKGNDCTFDSDFNSLSLSPSPPTLFFTSLDSDNYVPLLYGGNGTYGMSPNFMTYTDVIYISAINTCNAPANYQLTLKLADGEACDSDSRRLEQGQSTHTSGAVSEEKTESDFIDFFSAQVKKDAGERKEKIMKDMKEMQDMLKKH